MQMQVSVELMICELGLSVQPFLEDYGACESWVTRSWLKTVWEKADWFGIDVRLVTISISYVGAVMRDTSITRQRVSVMSDTRGFGNVT